MANTKARTAPDPDELLPSSQCAEIAGIQVRTWNKYVELGLAPQPDDPDEDRPANRRIRLWKRSTAEGFRDNRKGRGAPGIPRPRRGEHDDD